MSTSEIALRKPVRLWPGVIGVSVQWFFWFFPGVLPIGLLVAMIGVLAGTVTVVVWWLFFSRARWAERLGALVVIAIAMTATRLFLDKSILTGMMGMMFNFYVVPGLCLALVAAAAIGRRLSDGPRRLALVAAIVIACAAWTLARTDGILVGRSQLAWRWTPTAEERLLAQTEAAGEVPPPPAAPADVGRGFSPGDKGSSPGDKGRTEVPPSTPTAPEWPGFRGPGRDGVARGVRIKTDWSSSPPVQMWRRPIGPGWSSFAVAGDLLYTQEQRGDSEIVACYKVSTGKPVWMHRDPTRFWESNAGAGPRATPTLHNGRVYTFGATGIVNVLDAGSGAVVWTHNAAADTKMEVPMWGFSSSPLVLDDAVVVATAGTLASYDLATGKLRWVGPQHNFSYSSPQLVTIDGVRQILLLSPPGVVSVAPADGALLWEHSWEGGAIVQPAVTAEGDVLINAIAGTGGIGLRRVSATHGPGGWKVEERWTSTGLKPYFNDYVLHKGHAFGFDGSILACIDLADGKRKWKGGRYGEGQLVLLADQDVLLVLSEEGELALVEATPDKFTELARFPAIEGKTWNHPVLVGDVLMVRNGEQMAAFRLALAGH